MQISGLHHVTTMAGDPQENINFYTQVMGLRLVKVTVNFDAPNVYHLYYGDATAQPGSILTFFPFKGARQYQPGIGQTFATAFAVPSSSLDFWREHLSSKGIPFDESERFGETVLSFEDHDTVKLELIGHEPANSVPTETWDTIIIPTQYAIRGFHGVTLWESSQEPTATLLTDHLGLKHAGEEGDRVRYLAEGDHVARHIDIIAKPQQGYASGGIGSVHHIAWRTPDDPTQLKWQERIGKLGFGITEVKDRQYFHSIYFREPGGVLFEIATDTPGFTLDEDLDNLGQELKLPPWLEGQRELIERQLQPIERPQATKKEI